MSLVLGVSCAACGGEEPATNGGGGATPSPPPASSTSAQSSTEAGTSGEPSDNGTPSGSSAPSSTPPDGATPPVVTGATRGAVSLHVVPKGECSLGDVWIDFPEVANGHPVTATSHDVLSEDGTRDAEGREIKAVCEWLSLEDPVRASLGISADSAEDGRYLSMTAVLSESGSMPSRLVVQRSFTEPQWGGGGGHECLFSNIAIDLDGESVWGSFVCPTFVPHDDSKDLCEVVEGYFYFENCKPREI